jgi:hypothetical protein
VSAVARPRRQLPDPPFVSRVPRSPIVGAARIVARSTGIPNSRSMSVLSSRIWNDVRPISSRSSPATACGKPAGVDEIEEPLGLVAVVGHGASISTSISAQEFGPVGDSANRRPG